VSATSSSAEQRARRAADDLPAARGIHGIHGRLVAADADAARHDALAGRVAARRRELAIEAGEIAESRHEAEHRDLVGRGRVQPDQLVGRDAAMLRDDLDVLAELAAVTDGNLDRAHAPLRDLGGLRDCARDRLAHRIERVRDVVVRHRRDRIEVHGDDGVRGHDVGHAGQRMREQVLGDIAHACDDGRGLRAPEFDDEGAIAEREDLRRRGFGFCQTAS
jgi:hypothetical protein